MELKNLIQQDLNKALKNKEKVKVSVLRGVLNGFQVQEKKEQKKITEQESLDIVFKELKQREESIKEFTKGKREDLVEKEKREVEVLQSYLPEPLSEQELRQIVEKAIKKTQATEPKHIKEVMAEVIPHVGFRARKDQLARLIKDILCQ